MLGKRGGERETNEVEGINCFYSSARRNYQYATLAYCVLENLIDLNHSGSPPSHHSHLALLVPAPGEHPPLPRQHQVESMPRRYLHYVRPIFENNAQS